MIRETVDRSICNKVEYAMNLNENLRSHFKITLINDIWDIVTKAIKTNIHEDLRND